MPPQTHSFDVNMGDRGQFISSYQCLAAAPGRHSRLERLISTYMNVNFTDRRCHVELLTQDFIPQNLGNTAWAYNRLGYRCLDKGKWIFSTQSLHVSSFHVVLLWKKWIQETLGCNSHTLFHGSINSLQDILQPNRRRRAPDAMLGAWSRWTPPRVQWTRNLRSHRVNRDRPG